MDLCNASHIVPEKRQLYENCGSKLASMDRNLLAGKLLNYYYYEPSFNVYKTFKNSY